MAGKDQVEVAKNDTGGKPKGRRRRTTIIIVVVALILGIAAGIAYYLYHRQFVTTDDAFIDGQIVLIAAQQTGQLTEVAVTSNVTVAKGDLLARIDGAGPIAALDLARAQVSEAEAATGQAEAGIAQAKAAADGARSKLKGAQVTARNARTKADRLSQISENSGQQAVSIQALDDALATAQEAEATADAAKTDVATSNSAIAAAEAGLKSAQAVVVAAKAGAEQAQVTVGNLTITAPIDGQVVQVNASVGSYVTPGTQIMALVPRELFVTANFKETQLAQIRTGQKVDITVDAFPDVAFKGTVQSIQNGAGQAFQLLPPQNATGNFVKVVQRVPVRISIDGPSLADYPIGPGMSVEISIRLEG